MLCMSNEPQLVSTLLGRYRNYIRAPEMSVVKVFAELVQERFGVGDIAQRCRYDATTRTLFLTCGGPLKHELLIQQKEILVLLHERLGYRSAPCAIA